MIKSATYCFWCSKSIVVYIAAPCCFLQPFEYIQHCSCTCNFVILFADSCIWMLLHGSLCFILLASLWFYMLTLTYCCSTVVHFAALWIFAPILYACMTFQPFASLWFFLQLSLYLEIVCNTYACLWFVLIRVNTFWLFESYTEYGAFLWFVLMLFLILFDFLVLLRSYIYTDMGAYPWFFLIWWCYF
jgi:hypothetical protein